MEEGCFSHTTRPSPSQVIIHSMALCARLSHLVKSKKYEKGPKGSTWKTNARRKRYKLTTYFSIYQYPMNNDETNFYIPIFAVATRNIAKVPIRKAWAFTTSSQIAQRALGEREYLCGGHPPILLLCHNVEGFEEEAYIDACQGYVSIIHKRYMRRSNRIELPIQGKDVIR